MIRSFSSVPGSPSMLRASAIARRRTKTICASASCVEEERAEAFFPLRVMTTGGGLKSAMREQQSPN
jgi:fumarate hydratase class II